MNFGGKMRSVVDSTATSGSRKGRKGAITLLLLALSASAAQYAYRAWKKPFWSTKTTTDSACSEGFHPRNVQDYGKGSPRKARNLGLSQLGQPNPTLPPSQRPGFFQPFPFNNHQWTDKEWFYGDSRKTTDPTGRNWPYEGKQHD